MRQALERLLHPVEGQPLNLGMSLSLGLHLLLAGSLLYWPGAWVSPPTQPEVVQTVKLVELPPPAPKPSLPPPPAPAPVRLQPRLPPRVSKQPASTSRPGPVYAAAQEKPAAASGPSVAAIGEAIGHSGQPAAPASGGPAPLGTQEVAPSSADLGPYKRLAWQRIERNKRYPSLARARQLEGSVALRFLLSPQGRIKALEVMRSSGADELDQAAQQAVRSAAPFPPPPGAAEELWMELTVKFELH